MRSLAGLAAALDVVVPVGLDADRVGCLTANRLVLAAIKQRRPMPEELFAPVMDAAIHHPDPSHNAFFVQPLVGDFGRRRVMSTLIDVMRNGTDEDRPGAANAWYQSLMPVRRLKDAIPEARRPPGFDDTAGLGPQWQEACLKAFMATDDVDVRRAIVGIMTPAFVGPFADHLQGLIAEMVRQVRESGDAYMNSRIG